MSTPLKIRNSKHNKYRMMLIHDIADAGKKFRDGVFQDHEYLISLLEQAGQELAILTIESVMADEEALVPPIVPVADKESINKYKSIGRYDRTERY